MDGTWNFSGLNVLDIFTARRIVSATGDDATIKSASHVPAEMQVRLRETIEAAVSAAESVLLTR